MDQQVEIQTIDSYTTDEYKQKVAVWQSVGKRWAEINEGSGREFWSSQQVQSSLTHVVRIRYFPGITTKSHRVVWQGRTLNIDSIANPDGRKVYHVLRCIENFSAAQAPQGK